MNLKLTPVIIKCKLFARKNTMHTFVTIIYVKLEIIKLKCMLLARLVLVWIQLNKKMWSKNSKNQCQNSNSDGSMFM